MSDEISKGIVARFRAAQPAQSAAAVATAPWRREMPKPALVTTSPEPGPEAAPTPDDARPPILNPNAPMDNAREFARGHCYRNGVCIVWYWQDQFWRWNGKVYAAEEPEETEGQVWKFLDGALRWSG